MKKVTLLFVLIAGGLAGLWLWQPSTVDVPAIGALESLLIDNGSAAGFARATAPGAVQFPRDFGPHEEYQTEWWYYTGNLQDGNGRDFGYQFTIFRRALQPLSAVPDVKTPSDWRANQIYLAHFTISDIEEGEFYVDERYSRGAVDLAGARAAPYAVWLEDWSATEISPGTTRIQAKTGDTALDIALQQTLPPVLHGEDGLSRKGPQEGNASYYYSIVQQDTAGTLRLGDKLYEVSGLSWKDHEYSTSALSPGSVGWDWFSLQLNDGSALMLFQIRREDGTIDPFSGGSYIKSDGSLHTLNREAWQLDVLDTWTSPSSGAVYPAGWRLRVPELALDLQGWPLMANQELNVSTVYWEGAVDFTGTIAGQSVTARGYTEMTGYAVPSSHP